MLPTYKAKNAQVGVGVGGGAIPVATFYRPSFFAFNDSLFVDCGQWVRGTTVRPSCSGPPVVPAEA